MSAYREGYEDGRRNADWSECYFGDDLWDYLAGQEDAWRDLEDDEDAYFAWLDRAGDDELDEVAP